MAEIDTGLGWAASDEYLVFSDNITLGSYGGYYYNNGQYPEQPVPVTGSAGLDIVSRGVLFAESNMYAGYMGTDTPNCVFSVVSQQASNWIVPGAFAPSNTVRVFVCIKNKSSGSLGTVMTFTPNSSIGTHLGGEWYVGYGNSTPMGGGLSIKCPTSTAAVNNISFSGQNITKTNEGWAVACMAKWKTSAGVIINTPTLISSVSEYTDMTLNDPAHSIAKLNVLRNGMRFYMSFFDITDETPVSSQLPTLDLSSPDEPARSLETVFAYIADLDHAAILVLNSPDPYGDEGGNSGEDGGGGDSDPDDDPVEEETLPLPSVAGLGFCTIYVPTDTDLMNLAAYLWGGNLDLDNFLRLFANPMDSILGLSVVPVSLSGTYSPIYMGGQLLQNITMPKYSGRTSIKVDMGTTTIEERWGSYLDYDPYTELSLYLPFIGIKNIKADDVMGKTISLMYSIDILSGACVAYIRTSGGSVLYEWSGQCALQVPVTGQNWDNIFATAATTAAAIGGALFAPSAVSAGAIASTAVQAIAAKPRVERSGAVNGITGFLGQMRPYLIRVIPEAYIPANQNKFIGYPSYITATLGNLTGYNEISSIHLEGIPATGNELTEIETLLKGGVIF